MYENELNEMRQQMAILKNKLDRQEIVNDHIIRRSMKRNVGNIKRRYYFVMYIGRATGKITALNKDKYHILKQRNWRCNIEPTMDELGYHARYDLSRGVKETIGWYKANGWL